MRTCDHGSRLAELDLQDQAICNFRTEFWDIPYRTFLFGGIFTFLCGFAVFVTPYALPSHRREQDRIKS